MPFLAYFRDCLGYLCLNNRRIAVAVSLVYLVNGLE